MQCMDASGNKPHKVIEEQPERTARLEHVRSDAAERKRAEEAKDQLYQSIMENAFVAVSLIDRDYTIRMINDVSRKWFDDPADDQIGQKCFRKYEKRESICPNCPGKRAMETGRPAQAHREAVRDDGSSFPVRLQTFPTFDQNG